MRSAIERDKQQARGIIIRHGAFVHERSAFWAYLWSEEMLSDDSLALSRESRVTTRETRGLAREQ